MITTLIIVCLLLFVPACIGPLLMSEKTSDLAQKKTYRLEPSDPCAER